MFSAMTHKIGGVGVEEYAHYVNHRRSQGRPKGPCPPNFWKTVILCFERHFSKQNSVVRLKSNILPPPKFWAGYATDVNKLCENIGLET